MIQQIITLAACLAIITITEPAINRMNCSTPLLVRFGIWALCVSAAAAILFILLGSVPPWPSVIGSVGCAVYLASDRRNHAREKFTI